jgi:exosome complex RNA-binding protein Rrp4
VITFGSNGKIWIDGVLKNTITGTQNSTGAITIITGVNGNTWEISRFKYYNRTLTDAEITSNSSKQKTELGF